MVGAHYSVTVPSPNTAACVKCCEKKIIKKEIAPASRLARAWLFALSDNKWENMTAFSQEF